MGWWFWNFLSRVGDLVPCLAFFPTGWVFLKKIYHCYVLTSFHVYKMQPANTSRGQSSVGLTAWATLHSTGLDSWVFSYCYRCRFRWHGILNMLGPTQDFSCSATQNQKNLFERESQGVAEQKQSIYSTWHFAKEHSNILRVATCSMWQLANNTR